MMNIENLGSKESLGVKFKNDICIKLCLSYGLEATGLSLLRQDGSASNCQETKFQTIVCFKNNCPEVNLDSCFQSNDGR